MHYNISTLDCVDATNGSWLVVMEVDPLAVLNGDCREGVLGVDGYGDIFAAYEFL